MLHFESDYMEGAHPRILERLAETNFERTAGYGADPYSERARQRIRAACGCPDAAVFFTVGGTQTNAVAADALLRPWQGVLAAESGHIGVHEAGAIEATGHTVLTLPHRDGKLRAAEVEAWIRRFYADANFEHMVAPGMVYVSHPTEWGTLYTRAELEALRDVCRRHGIPLYLDGARMAYALAAEGTDVGLETVAACCDVFYIGGTKCGALFGEAVVFPDPALAAHFFSVAKRRGAVLAKGRLLGIQFDTLFADGLYMRLGARADALAAKLRRALADKGYELRAANPTNQIFVVVENERLAELSERAGCAFWEAADEHRTVVRFALGWDARASDVDELIALLEPRTP